MVVGSNPATPTNQREVAQVGERGVRDAEVAGSIPVFPTNITRLEHCGWAVKFRLDVIVTGQTLTYKIFGALAQSGERLSGRQKVKGSIPLGSTKIRRITIQTVSMVCLLCLPVEGPDTSIKTGKNLARSSSG